MALAPLTYLPHLEHATDAFAALLEAGDLDALVPGCPGWRLTDLAHHLGGIHRWAREAVVEAKPGAMASDGPTDRAALAAWFREGAAALTDTLRTTDPRRPAGPSGRSRAPLRSGSAGRLTRRRCTPTTPPPRRAW